MSNRPLFLVPLLVCFACSTGAPTGDTGGKPDSCSGRIERSVVEETSDDGEATFFIDVPADTRSMLVTVTGADWAYLDHAADADGEDLVDADTLWKDTELLTYAAFPSAEATTFNWPVREEDGPLTTGEWTLDYKVFEETSGRLDPVDGAELTASVRFLRGDDEWDRGCLRATVAYADGMDRDDDLVAAVEGAVEHWIELYDDWDIELRVEYSDSDIDEDLPLPSGTDRGIESLSGDVNADDDGLLVVVGELIEGDTTEKLGVSGGIPGPLEPTVHSAVVVGWLLHAGRDGDLDDDEIELMGKTMAHEVGHFLGLFHPVDFDDQADVAFTDALGDTDDCRDYWACVNDLGGNLMFPYYTPEEPGELTDGQVGVMQRYTGNR